MRNWLCSIIGITFVGILLDVLLKDSNNKLIKGIYDLICIYIIIQPIIKFLLGY